MTSIIQNMFSDYSVINLEIQNNKISRNSLYFLNYEINYITPETKKKLPSNWKSFT